VTYLLIFAFGFMFGCAGAGMAMIYDCKRIGERHHK